MDRKILILLLAALLPVFFTSCEKDADIPLPKQDPRLVVYSYICPDDTLIQVAVTASNPIFNTSTESDLFSNVETATVVIAHNGNSYTLTWDPTYSRYTIGTDVLPVVAGHTYDLSVSAAGFETVSASTQVPQQHDWQFNVTYYNQRPPNQQFGIGAEYLFDVNWKHYDDNHYYRLSQNFYYVDTLIIPDTLIENRDNTFYSSDQVVSGTVSDRVTTGTAIYQDPYTNPYGFHYDLIVSTYDYFKFHESINNYSTGDPFAEPSLVYSNMKNGYGIFAGYLKVTKRIHY